MTNQLINDFVTKSDLLLTVYKRSGTKNDLDKDRFSFLMAAQALEQRMLYISTLIDKSPCHKPFIILLCSKIGLYFGLAGWNDSI